MQVQVKIEPTGAARRAAFLAGNVLPQIMTLSYDLSALSQEDRQLLVKYCGGIETGHTRYMPTVDATNEAEFLGVLMAKSGMDEARDAKETAEKREHLAAFVAGQTDELNHYYRGETWVTNALLSLPEFANIAPAVNARISYNEEEAARAKAAKEEAREARIAEAARKEEEAQAAREAWIAEHGTEYLKRLAADGYEYTQVAREEWAAINAPGFSNCEEWKGFKSWEGCTTPSPADLSALDSAREAFPGHSAQVVTIEYHDESEETAIQVRFNTPFGAPALEKLVSDFDATEPVRRELTAEAAQRRR